MKLNISDFKRIRKYLFFFVVADDDDADEDDDYKTTMMIQTTAFCLYFSMRVLDHLFCLQMAAAGNYYPMCY